MWLWSLEHLKKAKDAKGDKLYQGRRQGVTFPLADALCWLLASRQQILDLVELEAKGPQNPVVTEGLEGTAAFFTDLCHAQVARAAGEVGRICAELIFGYNRHPAWEDEAYEGCIQDEDLVSIGGALPGLPGLSAGVPPTPKAGPCVGFQGYEEFVRMRVKLDGCLTGSQLAKDRAAHAVAKVMIPAALDYPA